MMKGEKNESKAMHKVRLGDAVKRHSARHLISKFSSLSAAG